MIIALPMIVLGLFAERGGLRFTVFAVPFFALGDAYIVYLIAKLFKKLFINNRISNYFKYIIASLLMIIFVYPNYKHIHEYVTPAVMNKNEIQALVKFKNIAKRDDYVLSWWDYGYPIRYYADVKTLVDGGKHSGDVNFPVSFALTRPQLASHNTAILDTYFTEKHFIDHKKFDFIKDIENYYNVKINFLSDLEKFLSKKIILPKIKENIYYFLPFKMMNIFPTVSVFSSINIKNGKFYRHFFYKSSTMKKIGNNVIIVGRNIKLLLNKAILQIGNDLIPIKSIDVVRYNNKGQLIKNRQVFRSNGFRVILMKSYGTILIMDDYYYYSTYIQLFVFDNYNKKLFKPVILNPLIKIYKVIKN
jgi:undecaprenyl-diphosphooligosaccharide--protein glycosyltransferase